MWKKSVFSSLCIHLALVILLLLTATLSNYTSTNRHSITTLENPVRPLTAPRIYRESGSSGGGHQNPLPPQRGEIPRVARPYIPLMPQPRETPQTTLPSGLEDMPQIAADVPIGVPTGINGTFSPGPGKGPGIGGGEDGRAGDGKKGRGPGGRGPNGIGWVQRLTSLPQLLFKKEPEYSEEARKARHQGSVMLSLEIDSEGRPRNIRVVQSLGLGLDERAVEAVSQWRFKPGLLNGRPVTAPVSVEVSFRLL